MTSNPNEQLKPQSGPTGSDRRHQSQLRQSLNYSQKESVASSLMTATGDNFFNAFAIHLGASAMQISSLTALPQFLGAFLQVLSVSISKYFLRKHLVVVTAGLQALVMFAMALLATAAWMGLPAVQPLLVLAIAYHGCLNVIQPHWRAWMGSLVPAHRRGVFFAARTRLTMVSSLLMFLLGGAALTFTTNLSATWSGFVLIFVSAGIGRAASTRYLGKMHDPDPHPDSLKTEVIVSTLVHCRDALRDSTFRRYSFFVACMQGAVAISAPFFAVYMLEVLEFTYLEFAINSIASIALQFLTLGIWGRISDKYGNRWIMLVTSIILPTLPLLWLVSSDFYYLIAIQCLSGIGWAGFNLSTGNYLYDIRPHKSNFALYAALQSSIGATLIFVGALFGGWIASHSAAINESLPIQFSSAIFIVFLCSFILRTIVTACFIPGITEPHIRPRPNMLKLIFRVSRFSAVSGTVLDWISVAKKK